MRDNEVFKPGQMTFMCPFCNTFQRVGEEKCTICNVPMNEIKKKLEQKKEKEDDTV